MSFIYEFYVLYSVTSNELSDGLDEEENLLTDLGASTLTTNLENKSNDAEEQEIQTTFRPVTVADALNPRNNDTSNVSKGIYFDDILT